MGCMVRSVVQHGVLAELHVPPRTVTASASQTRIITILLCSLCTPCTASKSLLNTKLTPKLI